MPDPMWRCPSMGQIQREMIPETEQSLCTAFSEGVARGSLTRSAGDGGKQKKKPSGLGWDESCIIILPLLLPQGSPN